MKRRIFLQTATAGAAAAIVPSPLLAFSGAVDRINIGVIGLGFGLIDMQFMLEGSPFVHCTALCDVNKVRLEEQAKALKEKFPVNAGNIKLHTDFRKLLDDKDIHGVIIATPDHWHTYIFAEACKAGKAIYIEKPVGLTVADCNLMVELQLKYNNVVTTGLWQVSLDYFKEAFAILKSGALGDVYKAHAFITGSTTPLAYATSEPQTVPETFDYKMWTGPASLSPYTNERVKNWRHFWDYGGGRQTDWVHHLDSALDGIAALGHARTYPKSVCSVGYKHPSTILDVPSVQSSIFQFDNFHIIWEHQVHPLYNKTDGVAWIGSNGTLVCNRTGYEVIPQTDKQGKPMVEPAKKQGPYANQYNHMANWAECIRNNNVKTNSPIDKGAYATSLANIANISYRTGGKSLEYLPLEKKFRNNPEADSYIVREYKNNWKYPQL